MTTDVAISRIDLLLRVPTDDLRLAAEAYAGKPEAEPGFDFSVVLKDSEVAGGRAPFAFSRLFVAYLDIPDMLSLPGDRETLIGVVDLGDGSGIAGMLGLLEGSGEVVFFGDCARLLYQDPIDRYADRDGGTTDHALVTSIIVDDQELTRFVSWFQDAPTSVAWTDRAPQSRALDIEETPAEYLATLDTIFLAITIPAEWTSLDGAICSYAVDEGWNECESLAALGEQGSTSFELLGWASRGGTVELWLVRAFDLSTPVARLTTIENTMMVAKDGQLSATVDIGGTGAVSLADIAAIVERDDLAVTVTPGAGQ